MPKSKAGGQPAVAMPNPFYQAYAAAALSAGAEAIYVPATAETGFLPDYAALPVKTLLAAGGGVYLFAVKSRRRGGGRGLLGQAVRVG